MLHFLIAGTSTYYLAKSFFLKNHSSLAAAIFYSFSTKMMVQTSAGHITMVAAFAFFPLAFLSIRKILLNPNRLWIFIGGVSLAMILILYPTIFYYSLLFLILYVLYHLWIHPEKSVFGTINKLIPITLAILVGFGLSAIQLIPQLEFGSLSTRSQLRLEEVALPLWNFKKFLIGLIFPYLDFRGFDQESLLYLGFIPSVLAFLGFLHLSKIKKTILMTFGILTLMFVAGLSTPVFKIAYDFFPYLKYSRVNTRLWFVVALIVALLAARAIEKIKSKTVVFTLIALFLIESFYIFYRMNLKIPNLTFENQTIYQFLAENSDRFRVYCTTYCFNPQLISEYKIEVLHGETPIQDEKFIDFLQEAGNYEFDNFSVIFPPYQIWQVKNPPMPNAALLGLANVKYVASTYKLENNNFATVGKFDNVYLYQNSLYKRRVFFKNSQEKVEIEKYSPNRIIVKFKKSAAPRELVFSEKYYPGWFVYMNNQKFKVEEEEPIFRKIVVLPETDRLEMVYAPESFKTGRIITFGTIFFLIIYFLKNNKKWRK